MAIRTGEGPGDISIGLIRGDKNFVVVFHAELLEVEEDMMFVGHFERDLLYIGEGLEYGIAHGMEGMLDGEAFVRSEAVKQVETNRLVKGFRIFWDIVI